MASNLEKISVRRRYLSPKIHISLKDVHNYHRCYLGFLLEKERVRAGRGRKEKRRCARRPKPLHAPSVSMPRKRGPDCCTQAIPRGWSGSQQP